MSGRLFKAEPSVGRKPRDPQASRFARQRARAAELDAIRLQRPLTRAELAEADNLAGRLYMRLWRQQMRERFGGLR